MSCRAFEREVADWIGGRLSPEGTRRMAAHAQECVSCGRAVRAEQNLRTGWREAREVCPEEDVWPRIVAHLGACPSRRTPRRGGPAWAWSFAVALAAAAAFGLHHGPSPAPRGRAVAVSPPPVPARWPMLPGTSRLEPGVDDPVGASMEEVWTQIDTGPAAPGG